MEQTIHERDLKDYHREISPLRQAEDAIELNTDSLSIEQVQTRIVELYSKLAPGTHCTNGIPSEYN